MMCCKFIFEFKSAEFEKQLNENVIYSSFEV